jgi:hypothetical protein
VTSANCQPANKYEKVLAHPERGHKPGGQNLQTTFFVFAAITMVDMCSVNDQSAWFK